MYYVTICRLNGRQAFYQLAKQLEECGYGDRVLYCDGECDDATLPHLRFDDEGDAVAYCLTHGCTYKTSMPIHYKE